MKKSKKKEEAGANSLVGVLNVRLVEVIDLQMQCRQAHWNVKGKNFIALHEMFGRFYDELTVHVDDIAERTVGLGGIAYGTKEAVAELSDLPEYPTDIKSGIEHVKTLAASFAAFAKSLRSAIEDADDADDDVTEDLLTNICGDIEKKLWFLDAHLEEK